LNPDARDRVSDHLAGGDFIAEAPHNGGVNPDEHRQSFCSAAVTLTGSKLMHMIRKDQLLLAGEICPAQRFHSLAE
jgi:hypothetical protein